MRHRNSAVVASLSVLALGSLAAAPASAFEIDTGNSDIAIRVDNTVRYTYGQRVEKQDSRLTGVGAFNIDDGNRSFKRGDTVANRVDLLTEFDFVYANRHGFRVSAAAWSDGAYSSVNKDQPITWSNHLNGAAQAHGLSGVGERYAKGLSGEFLDAFLFTGFDVGDARVNLKLGKHTVVWGEALYSSTNSIAYAQESVDLAKGLQIPGVEAKELFRPRNAFSVQAVLSPEISIAAQKFFDWEPNRLPNPGTYLGFHDALGVGAESFLAAPGAPLTRGDDIVGSKNKDWGMNLRYGPEWLGGTMGFYYRNYTDMLQIPIAQPGKTFIGSAVLGALGNPALCPLPAYLAGACDVALPPPFRSTAMLVGAPAGFGNFYHAFPGDIDLYGFSLGKTIAGVSTGFELSYRKNTPLSSFTPFIVNNNFAAANKRTNPTFVNTTQIPDDDNLPVAFGNTLHVVLNGLGVISDTPLFDSAVWGAELSYIHLDKITKNKSYYKGKGWYMGVDRPDSDAYGITATFTPTWYKVFPSADLSMPIAYSTGFKGNSPLQGSINDGLGSYAAGLRLDYASKHQLELRYVGYFGQVEYGSTYAGQPAAQTPLTANGATATLRDRNQILLTFKTTF